MAAVLELDDPFDEMRAETIGISYYLWARKGFTMNSTLFCVADSHK